MSCVLHSAEKPVEKCLQGVAEILRTGSGIVKHGGTAIYGERQFLLLRKDVLFR